MVKNKSFGLALAKPLNRIVLLSFLLTGCAQAPMNSVEAAKAWDNRYEECSEIAEGNKRDFPTTPWFDSLTFEDKRSVIGYIYNYNQDICSSQAINDLKVAVQRDGNEKIAFEYREVLTPLDDLSAERMKGIDMDEVKNIQVIYSEPFSVRHVLTTLDLYTK